MKVLVSDKVADIGIKMFNEARGIDVDVKVGLMPYDLKAIIRDYEALVIRSATKVTEDLLKAADRLKVIGRAGIGHKKGIIQGRICLDKCAATGFNCPGTCQRRRTVLNTARTLSHEFEGDVIEFPLINNTMLIGDDMTFTADEPTSAPLSAVHQ